MISRRDEHRPQVLYDFPNDERGDYSEQVFDSDSFHQVENFWNERRLQDEVKHVRNYSRSPLLCLQALLHFNVVMSLST